MRYSAGKGRDNRSPISKAVPSLNSKPPSECASTTPATRSGCRSAQRGGRADGLADEHDAAWHTGIRAAAPRVSVARRCSGTRLAARRRRP